jgi:tetratricopeptide (TPR) repeat protein
MKRTFNSLALALALTACFGGAAAAQAKAKTGLLTNERIIAMLEAKVSEGVILSLIKKYPEKLDSGPEALVELRAAGASNRVLLAVRGGALGVRRKPPVVDEEEPPAPEEAGQAAEAGTEEEAAADAGEESAPAGPGKLSLGLGYPFLAVKYDIGDYAGEGRFITRRGIQAFAGRGYWNFYRAAPWTAYTGLEAGYVRFGSAASGAELSPFIGGAYALDKDFSISADFSPTMLFLPGGGTHFGVDEIGWVINVGLFIRLPTGAPPTAAEAEEHNAAAAEKEAHDEELSSWRLAKAPSKISYQDYIAAADEALAVKNYAGADQAYAKALAGVSASDGRRVFLYERRGWLATKAGNLPKARDLYLAAVAAARQAGVYETPAVNAYCGLAYCFEKLDNLNLAIKYYQRALDISVDENARRAIEKNLKRLDPNAE